MLGARLPIGLAPRENPIGRFGEVSGNGADGDGVSLPLAGSLVELDDVLLLPVRVMTLPNHHIRRFDVPPLRYGMLREKPT